MCQLKNYVCSEWENIKGHNRETIGKFVNGRKVNLSGEEFIGMEAKF